MIGRVYSHDCGCDSDSQREDFKTKREGLKMYNGGVKEVCSECGKVGSVEFSRHKNKSDFGGVIYREFSDM